MKSYNMTVRATDPSKRDDTIKLTIEVINVNEPPLPPLLGVAGKDSYTYEENGTEALGTYEAEGREKTSATWKTGGADGKLFDLTGMGASRTLKFKTSPDYDNPRGQDKSETMDQHIQRGSPGHDGRRNVGGASHRHHVTNVDELNPVCWNNRNPGHAKRFLRRGPHRRRGHLHCLGRERGHGHVDAGGR